MAVIDRKFDRKIFIMRSRTQSCFFSIHHDRCRDLGKVTAVVIARSNNRDRHNLADFKMKKEKGPSNNFFIV